jgi:hypothetical protein
MILKRHAGLVLRFPTHSTKNVEWMGNRAFEEDCDFALALALDRLRATAAA